MHAHIQRNTRPLACLVLCLSACSPQNTQVVLAQQPPQEVLFPVRGETLREVGAGVHGHLQGGFAGHTRWHMDYATDVHESFFGTCTAKKITVNLQSKVVLPHWQSSSPFTHPNVQLVWNRFIAALRLHEQGHAQIALKQAQALVAQLQALSPIQGKSCDAVHRLVRERFNQAISDTNTASERYDLTTQHGATQGTKPPWFD